MLYNKVVCKDLYQVQEKWKFLFHRRKNVAFSSILYNLLLWTLQHAETLVLLMKTSKKPTSKLQKFSMLQKMAWSTQTVDTPSYNGMFIPGTFVTLKCACGKTTAIMACVW